jgi:hypothetical protein
MAISGPTLRDILSRNGQRRPDQQNASPLSAGYHFNEHNQRVFPMTAIVTFRRALEDPEMLGAAIAGPSSHAWRALLVAAIGERLSPMSWRRSSAARGRSA